MKHLMMVFAACAAMVLFAEGDPLADYTKFYWNDPDGGDWNDPANWVMEDGAPAATYPKAATDAAVFNGLGKEKTVSIPKGLSIDPGVVSLEDGCTSIYFGDETHVRFLRFLRAEHATMILVADGWNWERPDDFTIANMREHLVNGAVMGVHCRKDAGQWDAPRSVGGDISGSVYFAPGDDTHGYGPFVVSSSMTFGGSYSFLYGANGDGRSIVFEGDYVLTIPCGQIMQISLGGDIGTPDRSQGTIKTGRPLYLWERTDGLKVRSMIDAPKVIAASHNTANFYDDHSRETCDYIVPAGVLKLGGFGSGCTLGSGEIDVSWSGGLDVESAGALKNIGAIRLSSYRGQGSKWGKITMGISDTVTKVYLDGESLKRGTYGATGSGARFIDDVHFAGTGVLTVLIDDIPEIFTTVK